MDGPSILSRNLAHGVAPFWLVWFEDFSTCKSPQRPGWGAVLCTLLVRLPAEGLQTGLPGCGGCGLPLEAHLQVPGGLPLLGESGLGVEATCLMRPPLPSRCVGKDCARTSTFTGPETALPSAMAMGCVGLWGGDCRPCSGQA